MRKYRVTRFKRIYIEITSCCNLSCSFCSETLREKRFMSIDEFRHVINEVYPYTGFIYLHVKGEPLLHPNLEDILRICRDANMNVNITTNGTLLKKRLDTLIKYPVHQINISVHSAEDNDCINLKQYFGEIFKCCEILGKKTDTEISLRLWTTKDKPNLFGQKNLTIKRRLYINVQSPFEWPDLTNKYFNDRGICQGLRTHIAGLSDGTVVPCCLDGIACVSLGNIFSTPLSDILQSRRAVSFTEGFRQNRAVEPLCGHCSFKERFAGKIYSQKNSGSHPSN